jgi:hypothetical protein
MQNMISIQDQAIQEISALRKVSKYAYSNVCGRLCRSVRPIHRRFDQQLSELGFTNVQRYAAWRDVCDMVILHDNAE